MIKPSDIIRATGSDPSKPVSAKNPLGRGHCFYGPDPTQDPPRPGRIFKCAGTLVPNPDFTPGSDLPEQIVIDQHVILTLLEVPLDGREAGVVPTERADEAKWELDPAQESMSADDAVCQVCSSPIVS